TPAEDRRRRGAGRPGEPGGAGCRLHRRRCVRRRRHRRLLVGAAARRAPGRQRGDAGGRGGAACLAPGAGRRAHPLRRLPCGACRTVPRLAADDAGHPVRRHQTLRVSNMTGTLYGPGTLYGLGIGPGDPELITLKALRLLKAAPVLAYPAPEQGDSLARAIVAAHLPGGQTEIVLRMPMVAARFPAQEVYDRAAVEI